MTHALLLVGHGTRDPEGAAEFLRFVESLAPRWPDRAVYPCFLELAEPPVLPVLDRAIAAGAREVTVAPAFLLGAGHVKNDLPSALDAVRARHPGVTIHYGAPLGVESRLLQVLARRIAGATDGRIPASETAILLVGRGTTDPDANADVYKLGRLLWEGQSWRSVECAFVSLARPSLPEGIARCVALGARRVVVAPLFFFTGLLVRRIGEQAREAARHYPENELVVAPHLGGDPLLGDLLAQRVAEAEHGRVTMSCDSCVYRAPLAGFEERVGLPRFSDEDHGLRGHHHGHSHVHGNGWRQTGAEPPEAPRHEHDAPLLPLPGSR